MVQACHGLSLLGMPLWPSLRRDCTTRPRHDAHEGQMARGIWMLAGELMPMGDGPRNVYGLLGPRTVCTRGGDPAVCVLGASSGLVGREFGGLLCWIGVVVAF